MVFSPFLESTEKHLQILETSPTIHLRLNELRAVLARLPLEWRFPFLSQFVERRAARSTGLVSFFGSFCSGAKKFDFDHLSVAFRRNCCSEVILGRDFLVSELEIDWEIPASHGIRGPIAPVRSTATLQAACG